MKKFIYISLVFLVLVSCEKDREEVSVSYEVGNAYSPTEISYRNISGEIINETFDFQSVEDVWKVNYTNKRGKIVYLSVRYSDSTSSANARILVNGKVYKQGSSNNEPNKYIIVSGTIPY